VCLTLDIPFPQSVAKQKKYLTTALQFQKTGLYKHFTIRHDDDIIGMIKFKNINQTDYYAEVGYWMSEGCDGNGYMTQALKQATQYGFTELNLHKIYAYVCVLSMQPQNEFLKKQDTKKEQH